MRWTNKGEWQVIDAEPSWCFAQKACNDRTYYIVDDTMDESSGWACGDQCGGKGVCTAWFSFVHPSPLKFCARMLQYYVIHLRVLLAKPEPR